MIKIRNVIIVLACLVFSVQGLKAGSPMNKTFGLGVMLGEPTGLTAKFWTKSDLALAVSVGNSYFGDLRVGLDYLWQFDAFNSSVVNLYAGPGVAVGIGKSSGWIYNDHNSSYYKENSELSLGVRGVFGVNIVPKNTPLEFFVELGVMVALAPNTFANTEGAVGFRFYF